MGRVWTFLHECERWLLSRPLARYILDVEIKKNAWSKKVKIIQLETIHESLEIGNRMSLEIKNQNLNGEEPEKNKKTKILVRVNNWFTDQIADFIAIEGWQKGYFDEDINKGIPAFISKERNVKWLKSISLEDVDRKKYMGLLELLKNTKTPTCIAVGAGHCLDGKENQGLIWALQEDEDYVVERMIP